MFERIAITLGLALLGVCVFVVFRYDHLRRASKAAVAIGKPAILYFRSDACRACTTQGRFLQQLQAEFGDRIVVEKVERMWSKPKLSVTGFSRCPPP